MTVAIQMQSLGQDEAGNPRVGDIRTGEEGVQREARIRTDLKPLPNELVTVTVRERIQVEIQAIFTTEDIPPPPPVPPDEEPTDPPISRGDLQARFLSSVDVGQIEDIRIDAVVYRLSDARFDGSTWRWRLRPESQPWVPGQTVTVAVKLRGE